MSISTIDRSCYYYNKSLPIPLYTHQLAHFHSANKLFIFGGITTGDAHSSSIYRWNANNELKWFEKINETTTTTQFYSMISNVVVINDRMAYFIGINDGSYTSGKIYVFDGIQERFIDNNLSQPPFPAISGCLTTNNTHIFMVGGYNGSSYVDYIQIYDIVGYQWHFEQIKLYPLNMIYYQYCVMVNNIIFIFGGYGHHFGNYSNKYYSYNSLTKQWKYLGDKSMGSSAGTSLYNYPYIYLVGGWNGSSRLNIIDVFKIKNSTITNTNISSFSMAESLSGLTSSILHSNIYLFGGRNSSYDEVTAVQTCFAIDTLTPTKQPTKQPNMETEDYKIILILGCIFGICIIVIIVIIYIKKKRNPPIALLNINNDEGEEGNVVRDTQYIG